ncbi:DUF87 domain-containing protein [Limnohabitans sp.]|uniref:type IV secretory system conjugative DNA transfer family protein n=1 Tax=Limnohabitans sp. TaxID=1907725 RepID=UPI00333EC533
MWPFSPRLSKEEKETQRLFAEVRRLRAASFFDTDEKAFEFIRELLGEALEEAGVSVDEAMGTPLLHLVLSLLSSEDFLIDLPETLSAQDGSLKEGVMIRQRLTGIRDMLVREEELLPLWRSTMKSVLVLLLQSLPTEALADPRTDGSVEAPPRLSGSLPLCDMIEDFPVFLEKLMLLIGTPDVQATDLFDGLLKKFERGIYAASGIAYEDRLRSKKKIIAPPQYARDDPRELLDVYAGSTPFVPLLSSAVTLPIPRSIRFEHTHIVAGTGHGKTQLLQYLIDDDLEQGTKERQSLVIFDPHGDLMRTMSRSIHLSAAAYHGKVIFIDPTDRDFPVHLNLFDSSGMEKLPPEVREGVQNNSLDFFEYFFQSFLGSELTGRQSALFRYVGILLLSIPGASIHTLRKLMEDGREFQPYMERLDGTAKLFFETRFFDASLRETKKQVLSRIYGVLSNQTLDRMMSGTGRSLDLYQALQDGSVIFVNTSLTYMGAEASGIFTRALVALLGQALLRRSALHPADRTPTFVYLDEAGEVIDPVLIRLLTAVRKYKGAFTFAHQHMGQLGAAERDGVLTNTSIKLYGGLSHKDALLLAPEMRTSADFLESRTRKESTTQFALFAKNVTETALTFSVPLGFAEKKATLPASFYETMREASRARFPQVEPTSPLPEVVPEDVPLSEKTVEEAPASDHVTDVFEVPDVIEDTPPNVVPLRKTSSASLPVVRVKPTGGGGVRHQYLASLLQSTGESCGFKASLEYEVQDSGRVDVLLSRNDETLFCEISVTTSREHELGNVRKCFEAGGTSVVVLASTERQRTSLRNYMGLKLSADELPRVTFLVPEEVENFFEAFRQVSPTPEAVPTVTRGYTVKSKVKFSSPDEALARRNALARVMSSAHLDRKEAA